MRRCRWVAILAVIGTVIAAFGVSSAGAQSGGGAANQASDVGVTPTTIHIAVVADVDVQVDPGVFAGSVAGVEGFA